MMKMKTLIGVVLCLMVMSFTADSRDFEIIKKTAKEKHQLILLNFSGSDWCGPCIRMKKEIFDNEQFLTMAATDLIMVNADFPRNKKNQLDKKSQKENEMLADKYDPSGIFPYTVLLDADGKVIRAWSGLPNENAAQFTAEIKRIYDAGR